jgi:hypothetical protein
MPQPIATPLQKKRPVAAKKAPKVAPEPGTNTYCLTSTTLHASEILGNKASIEELIACTMMLACGRRNRWNGPTGPRSRTRIKDATWLFYQHVEARAADSYALGFLDSLTLQQHYKKTREWDAAAMRGQREPIPEPWVGVGRDCGHGSNCMQHRHLSLEDLHEWKRDLPMYLRAGQQRAFALLRRRTNVRRAWALLRRHARAVDLAARVALYWQERTQMALCAPDGAGRAADCTAFAAEFEDGFASVSL